MGNVFGPPPLAIAPAAPAADPSLTDDLVTKAAAAAKRRASMGTNLASTFLTGPLGDISGVPTSKPSAAGK